MRLCGFAREYLKTLGSGFSLILLWCFCCWACFFWFKFELFYGCGVVRCVLGPCFVSILIRI